ncbi:helix-turn-helix domain-containing protein [Alcanivorax sp. VBW004]|jgi:transcriptional regulator with XRE-family HTH domain|uniref:helix-turn-helix domain-containing protein n=1 Tax=unclassified Alcanivorax TaxID=2638842 RepID=UPI0012BBEC6D|nr:MULTISPECIES: helix-turn-helix transcriptional regulator [unclassified Alcanivorax]MTT52983.1 helix-turn-helix domain-containing protein [Alcanivorax sp. VBW004]
MSGFPERLRSARKQLGLTQEQLAEMLHVTKASVSAWESGREKPRFALLPALREVLGVSLDRLVCGLEPDSIADPVERYGAQVNSEEEATLVKRYRGLSKERRAGLLAMLG